MYLRGFFSIKLIYNALINVSRHRLSASCTTHVPVSFRSTILVNVKSHYFLQRRTVLTDITYNASNDDSRFAIRKIPESLRSEMDQQQSIQFTHDIKKSVSILPTITPLHHGLVHVQPEEECFKSSDKVYSMRDCPIKDPILTCDICTISDHVSNMCPLHYLAIDPKTYQHYISIIDIYQKLNKQSEVTNIHTPQTYLTPIRKY